MRVWLFDWPKPIDLGTVSSHNVAAFSLNSVSALSQTLSVFLLSTLSRWGSSWALKVSLDSRGRREGR